MLTLNKTTLFQILFFSTFLNTSLIPEQISGENSKHINQDVQFDGFNRIVYNSEKVKINYSIDEFRIANDKAKSKGNEFFLSNKSDNNAWNNVESHQLFKQNLLDSLTLEQNWKTGIFGSGIGSSGIVTEDINNDNIMEIICGGSTGTFGEDNFWYILEYSSLTNEYNMKWISDLYTEGISNIAAFDVNNDGVYNIYVGFSSGNLRVYDGFTFEEINYINTSLNSINRILYDDADNDLIKELVLCDDSKILICDSNTLNLEHQINYGANDFEIGNVDTDLENEIVLSNGKVIEYLNGIVTVEWQYPGGDFGYLVELSDIDSDNMKEIIGASNWAFITAFDADIQSPKWQIPTSQDIGALLVTDVDGDNIDDILYGDGQWGQIHCYNAINQTQKWQIANPEHGVTNITVVDADNDSNLEILWGAGATSTGPDYLYVHQISTLSFEWQSQHLDGPFYAIEVGDTDNDGDNEIVIISFESNSGYGDGIIQIFDAVTHELEWKSDANMFGGYAWTGIHDVKIGDVDDDSEQEIVVATDRLYDGAIYVINGTSHLIEQSYIYDDGAPIFSLAIADVDNDNQTEIIAGGSIANSGAPGVYVYVINGSTGVVEWHSINLSGMWSAVTALELADIDNDSVLEIVALNDNVFVIDGISHQQWQSTLSGCNGLDLYDIDYDDIEDIVVGTGSGKLIAIDGQNYSEKFNFTASSNEIVGLQTYDIQNDGNNEIIFGSAGQLNIFSISNANVIWQSETLGTIAGRFNSIVVSDMDSDQRTEIIIGTDYTVVGFQEPNVVPVELTSFTAVSQNGNAVLNWSTASELNTLGFEVQRKTNLYEFLTIGIVNAHGSTTESNRYSFVDSDLQYVNYSYRLKQVDFNGSFTYSEEVNVAVTAPLQFDLVQNYPNPFNPMTRISYSISEESFVTLRVYNIVGEEVETMVDEVQQPGNYSVLFNATNVSSGVYFYTINAGNFSDVKKMIISK
jgi:hypothetical protein